MRYSFVDRYEVGDTTTRCFGLRLNIAVKNALPANPPE